MEPHFIIIIASVAVLAIAAPFILREFRHEFTVPEGRVGLIYHHGLYVRRHNAGRHVIWGRGWSLVLIDLRRTSLLVPGEEFVLADKTSLRVGAAH
jgi:hypothetical protein